MNDQNINKTFKKYYKKHTNDIRKKTKKNKTIKKRIEKQKEICKNLELKEYHTFEDKIEKAFKDANLDFSTINTDLEKEIINELKKQITHHPILNQQMIIILMLMNDG